MRTVEERFWQKVIKGGGCWLWLAYTDAFGYGQIQIKGKVIRTHRFSYELHNGPIPEGMCVLHRCDVPGCVNPKHLFLGTKADNNADCASKGRTCRGEMNGNCVLSTQEVLRIRDIYMFGGISQRRIAAYFGIGRGTVRKVVQRMTWNYM